MYQIPFFKNLIRRSKSILATVKTGIKKMSKISPTSFWRMTITRNQIAISDKGFKIPCCFAELFKRSRSPFLATTAPIQKHAAYGAIWQKNRRYIWLFPRMPRASTRFKPGKICANIKETRIAIKIFIRAEWRSIINLTNGNVTSANT